MKKQVRFIHCADLHIDTPFKGISEIHPDLKKLLYQSTYQSFNNIVNLSLREKVDCVLIAGDVYDSADKSLQAQLRYRDGLQRLSDASIAAFVVHGNHDPLNSWAATLKWPENVFVFPGDRVGTFPLMKDGQLLAQIYGISFSKRDIYEDLALRFEHEKLDVPRIGLLHANIGPDTGHEPYAPCTIKELSTKGMDYWALGHVHRHTILKASGPAIVYSGSSQSRNPREIGEKGCCLVTLEQGFDPVIKFIPADVVRYERDILDISDSTTLDDVMASIKGKCEDISNRLRNRHAIIRLTLVGKSELHSELRKGNNVAELLEPVREYFEGNKPSIWLEKLILGTTGTYDLDALRQGSDFVADIISLYDKLKSNKCEHWGDIRSAFETLFLNWQGQKYLAELAGEELLKLAQEARDRTLDMIAGKE